MEYANVKDLFKDICNAIREKTGETSLINHIDIPDNIKSIKTSGTDTVISLDSNFASVEETTLILNTIADGNEVSY